MQGFPAGTSVPGNERRNRPGRLSALPRAKKNFRIAAEFFPEYFFYIQKILNKVGKCSGRCSLSVRVKIRYPLAGFHAVNPAGTPLPEPPFSGSTLSPIRALYVPRFPILTKRSPIRARIRNRRPLVWCESPGRFCQTGGPDDNL